MTVENQRMAEKIKQLEQKLETKKMDIKSELPDLIE